MGRDGRKKKRQVRKKKGRRLSAFWRGIPVIGPYLLKISFVIVGVAMVSLLFASLYEYLVKSPFMRLEEVIVRGGDEEFKEDVLKIARLKPDASLLSLKLDALKGRIEKHPWIGAVDLEKRFPRTLVIQVEKEEPLAIVALDHLYYMNRQGFVFTKVDQTGELDYPVITGVSMEKGGRKGRLDWAVRILKILESEKGPWSLADLSEAHFNGDGLIHLYFSSLPMVRIREGELGNRIGDLKKVIGHLQDTGQIHMVRVINLNYHDGAVVSYKNG